jgi:hypothetical protein
MAELKAYLVTCEYIDVQEGGMEIVQAETPSKAKYLSDMMNDVDSYTDLRAKRAPEFDGKTLNDRTYVENGWYIERFGFFLSKDWACDNGVELEFDESGDVIDPRIKHPELGGD